MNIGIIGYSAQKFDEHEATQILDALLQPYYGLSDVTIISGLTDLGIPAIAYRLAANNGLTTGGIACAKATHYDCFPCDWVNIIGDDWGYESKSFLNILDLLIRVGGGKQSLAEVNLAKAIGIPVIERELPTLIQNL